MFSKLSVPFVERTSIGTLGNTNQFESTHMHILIINTATVAIYFQQEHGYHQHAN